ncbi:DUF4232 domain-containing protein [Kitasatospora sp. NPDC094011]|uniref:DUF4232 domain-containing protein n=1 Tax=Kitasatospora sp. NPDC094011 TaxID=3364090 RepID=UPI003822F4AB
MSVRTSRVRLAVAASVALAALSLTACTDNDSGDIATATGPTLKAASSGAPTAPAPTAPAPSAAASGDGASGDTGKAPTAAPKAPTRIPVPPRPATPAKPVTCEGGNTRTTAAPLNRPVNHMLLTVTNTGTGACFLYGYPAVRFGEAQAVPPVIDDSKPQAVVTLQPGESGYASVNLSSTDGSNAEHGYTATSLTVYFSGPAMSESVGTGAHPALPAKGVYVDDSLKVTYWQQSMDDATSW